VPRSETRTETHGTTPSSLSPRRQLEPKQVPTTGQSLPQTPSASARPAQKRNGSQSAPDIRQQLQAGTKQTVPPKHPRRPAQTPSRHVTERQTISSQTPSVATGPVLDRPADRPSQTSGKNTRPAQDNQAPKHPRRPAQRLGRHVTENRAILPQTPSVKARPGRNS
jgi:hypothetical protein